MCPCVHLRDVYLIYDVPGTMLIAGSVRLWLDLVQSSLNFFFFFFFFLNLFIAR